MAICNKGVIYPGTVFVRVQFFTNFCFYIHFFGSNMLESQSRALKTWITANKNLSQKMSNLVGAQGQAKLAKKSRKHAPLWRHPQKTQTTNEKNALNLQSKTCWIRRWFEQLSSSIGWRVVALQTFQKMQKSGARGTQRVYFLFFKRIIEVLCLFHLLWQRTHQVLILKFYLLSTDANT